MAEKKFIVVTEGVNPFAIHAWKMVANEKAAIVEFRDANDSLIAAVPIIKLRTAHLQSALSESDDATPGEHEHAGPKPHRKTAQQMKDAADDLSAR